MSHRSWQSGILLAVLAACSEPAPTPPCEGCGAADDGTGGTGGTPGGEDGCRTSTDCREELQLPAPIWWDGTLDGEDPTCTVPLRSCQGPDECRVPTECVPAGPDATRLGAMRCERDEQCASGRCVSIGEVSICFRACSGDSDCPAVVPPEASPPVGFRCAELTDRLIPLRLCVPVDPALPSRTLCSNDCDCPAADGCPASEGEPGCRFVGKGSVYMAAVPACEPAPADARPTLSVCPPDPATCTGGACSTSCNPHLGPGEENFCTSPPGRCVEPCARDADCPARASCVTSWDEERIGSWPTSDGIGGRIMRYCGLGNEGCFDEGDCCPVPDGQGGCLQGWSAERLRCAVEITPPASKPRLLTRCVLPEPALALASPGQCCTGHGGCDSNLCVPARPGTPCDGSGVCSVPCDPDPARDRCATFDFGAQTYHRASSCRPFLFVQPYTDGLGVERTLEVELASCQ